MSSYLTRMDKRAKMRRGLPIEALGLRFYPITMTNYEEFLECKNVMALRITSLANLSIDYLSKPFLAALFAVDYDNIQATGQSTGLLERIVRLLSLSLRLGQDDLTKVLGFYSDSSDPRNLLYMKVTQDGKTVEITPVDFTTTVRPLIAEQNGIELPDDSQNPEILMVEQQMEEEHKQEVKFDIETVIASVASANHVRLIDIDEWTVKEFEQQRQALDRKINYMVYKQAELSGMVKFPRGNPFPSWCLDRVEQLTSALIPIDEMQTKYSGVGDVKQAVELGSQD